MNYEFNQLRQTVHEIPLSLSFTLGNSLYVMSDILL